MKKRSTSDKLEEYAALHSHNMYAPGNQARLMLQLATGAPNTLAIMDLTQLQDSLTNYQNWFTL